jgi:hypothetical protein
VTDSSPHIADSPANGGRRRQACQRRLVLSEGVSKAVRFRRALACAAMIALVLGCSKRTPTEPIPVPTPTPAPACRNLTGLWTDSSYINCSGSYGTNVMDVTQTGCTFTVRSYLIDGDITGVISGDTATVTINWLNCKGQGTGTMAITDRSIEGNITGTSDGTASTCCNRSVTGHIRFTKRSP